MELPDLGTHCSSPNCNKLDFLPIKCDVCLLIFCNEHYFYANHDCKNAHIKNNQVPVCPLCNIPIPVPPGQIPDAVVGAHIDNDCQSDPAIDKRKVFTNRCTLKGCKVKEVIPVLCTECEQNYCLKHRHPVDHKCGGKKSAARNRALNAAMGRQNTSGHSKNQQLSEDEALARALALSMQDSSRSNVKHLTQEEMDLALARQLQASEYQGTTTAAAAAGGSETNQSTKDKCTVL